jgi:hypothetical protein
MSDDDLPRNRSWSAQDVTTCAMMASAAHWHLRAEEALLGGADCGLSVWNDTRGEKKELASFDAVIVESQRSVPWPTTGIQIRSKRAKNYNPGNMSGKTIDESEQQANADRIQSRHQLKSFASELEGMARRNPLGAMAAALLVGVMIGVISRGRSS